MSLDLRLDIQPLEFVSKLLRRLFRTFFADRLANPVQIPLAEHAPAFAVGHLVQRPMVLGTDKILDVTDLTARRI